MYIFNTQKTVTFRKHLDEIVTSNYFFSNFTFIMFHKKGSTRKTNANNMMAPPIAPIGIPSNPLMKYSLQTKINIPKAKVMREEMSQVKSPNLYSNRKMVTPSRKPTSKSISNNPTNLTPYIHFIVNIRFNSRYIINRCVSS